jgi:acyl carrier protein
MSISDFIGKLAEQFDDTDLSELQPETLFQELEEWSSLTSLGIIALVRTEYGKKVTAQEIRACNTIYDLYLLAENKE